MLAAIVALIAALIAALAAAVSLAHAYSDTAPVRREGFRVVGNGIAVREVASRRDSRPTDREKDVFRAFLKVHGMPPTETAMRHYVFDDAEDYSSLIATMELDLGEGD